MRSRPPSFPERFLRHQRFEHRHPLMVVATRELEFRQLLSDAAVELFEPRRFAAARRPVAQFGKGRPPPEISCLRQLRRSSDQVAVLSVRPAHVHHQPRSDVVDVDFCTRRA